MLTRNDQPYMDNFNFANESIFNNVQTVRSNIIPFLTDEFLLLNTERFLLLDGTRFLLLGS